MYTTNWTVSSVHKTPDAYVTKGRQRIKQFGQTVFLKNGDNFEVELFNPLSEGLLAKIKLNGKFISGGGVVLRPGERIFLERFLDTNNKFLFETYEVDGDNPDVQSAIQSNGLVEVEFYMASSPSQWSYTQPSIQLYGNSNGLFRTNDTIYRCGGTTTTNNLNTSGTITFTTTGFGGVTSTPTSNFSTNGTIETGIVDKGEKSEQEFLVSNQQFSHLPFHSVQWHILPHSQKIFNRKDIRNYCGECGSRIKKSSYKFCPHCGTKID